MKRNHKPDFQIALGNRHGRWSKLSPLQRAGTVVTVVIQISLLVAALIDLRRRPAEQIRGNKRLWTLVVFINWVGPISYFLFGRLRQETRPTHDHPAPARKPRGAHRGRPGDHRRARRPTCGSS